MMTWFNSIKEGFVLGSLYVAVLSAPYFAISSIACRKVNIAKYIINALFVLYLSCVFAVVFLPLPAMGSDIGEYKCQLIPLFAVFDCIVKPSIKSVAQVLFNILLTVPFGAYLRFYWKKNMSAVIAMTFILTLFIEIGQLTGLFFIFNGSYRLFDVDDLICNTLGGVIGASIINKLNAYLPDLGKYDVSLGKLVRKTI